MSQIQKIETRIRREANRKGLVANYDFSMVIGTSTATRKTIELAKGFAKVQANILLVGETGTGKELFAQSIHKISPRMNGPFVAINCAALPESLLESELFGYVGGAFTGAAKEGKMGMFELAHGGTIFLDEISEMSLQLQGRLLRVIEEREIMRLGHDTVLPVDIRIIAATNRNLAQDVEENRFRKDLFYRLDVLRLDIPPLRHRREDIVPLARHFLAQADAENKSVVHTIDESAYALLQEHLWDGNVRQLRNICERLSVVVATQVVNAADVASCLGSATARGSSAAGPGDASMLHTSRAPLTTGSDMPARERIVEALACCDGNRTRTAKMLGMDRTTLYRHMLKHGLV
ncbi:MAG: sigma 54-interacting transcriptional regulator [Sphaerochaeta sp.]|nr:sigma 54-interacting transcriptional regulator [Sphaerochaeta sp.]